jgi:hypothetical protein
MYICPRNHESEAADFCSVCGIKMPPVSPQRQQVPEPPAGQICPECGAARGNPEQAVCAICGFNFRTKNGEVPQAERAASAGPGQSPGSWNVIVTIDADLFGAPVPDAPVNHPPQMFTLFEVVNVIGRMDGETRVHVPIATDDAVSRRQAVLTQQPDGSLTVRDLGSANGTFLNGKPLTPGVDTPVQDGDVIGIGAWTRITVRKAN